MDCGLFKTRAKESKMAGFRALLPSASRNNFNFMIQTSLNRERKTVKSFSIDFAWNLSCYVRPPYVPMSGVSEIFAAVRTAVFPENRP